MASANIAIVVVKGKVEGQDYRNVRHFGTNLPGWEANAIGLLSALAQAVMESYTTVLLPGLGPSIRIDGVTAQRIWPAITDPVEYTTGAAAGGAVDTALPSYVAPLLDIRTGGGGRRNRGRFFLPPPIEGHVDRSNLNTAGLALITAFRDSLAGKFIGATTSSNWNLGVLSRAAMRPPPGGTGANPSQAFREATALNVIQLLAVQRRRKIGKGS